MAGFINPYTFIPIEKGVKKAYPKYNELSVVSGKISCILKAKTQLALCDKVADREHDFFKVDGKAVIPGSSIRGTIRSIFEGLTDSCFSSTNAEDDDFFTSRLNKTSPGLLYFDGEKYILYNAIRYKDRNNSRLGDKHTGDEVRFSSEYCKKIKNEEIRYFELNGDKTGYVHKTERFKPKMKGIPPKMKGIPIESKDSIFEKKNVENAINPKFIKRLQVNIEAYSPKNKKIAKDYEAQFKKMKKGEGYLPVWFYRDGENYYFAPSRMSRAVFVNQPIDLLKKSNFDVCSSEEKVCEACALFGIIGRKGSDFVKASRVRFSDAVCEDRNCFDGKYILPISGTPRISSFEFYLRAKENQYSADTDGVMISGRKYYWHHKEFRISSDSKNKEGNNMDYRAELVKSGSEFSFEVYFDRITETELKKLIFALNLGENDINSEKCHKVGHGKPIGLGSAKIIVNNVMVREFRDGRYTVTERVDLLEDNKGTIFDNTKNVDYILKVTDMNAVDSKIISYPKTEQPNEIFKWFAGNREVLRSFGEPMKYYSKLPNLMDDNQVIPYSGKPPKDNNCNRNRNNNGSNRKFGDRGRY